MRASRPVLVLNCDRCLQCRKRRARELAARCVLHASCYDRNCFLTLTYDEKIDGYHNNFSYRDIQLFKKRLRSYVTREFSKSIEVFNVHEYGKQGKKHWHLIVFGFDFEDKEVFSIKNGLPLYTSDELERLWPFGFSTIGDVSEASAMYQAQYMEKDFKNGNVTNSKRSHSKHSGIGRPYFLQNYSQLLRLGYIPFAGAKLPLPRYFERLAHKHYCHFFEPEAFFDIPKGRKALHRPFKIGHENRHIAELFIQYRNSKNLRILEMEQEFNEVLAKFLSDKEDPDFVKSGSNAEYDFLNRNHLEGF